MFRDSEAHLPRVSKTQNEKKIRNISSKNRDSFFQSGWTSGYWVPWIFAGMEFSLLTLCAKITRKPLQQRTRNRLFYGKMAKIKMLQRTWSQRPEVRTLSIYFIIIEWHGQSIRVGADSTTLFYKSVKTFWGCKIIIFFAWVILFFSESTETCES